MLATWQARNGEDWWMEWVGTWQREKKKMEISWRGERIDKKEEGAFAEKGGKAEQKEKE